MKKLIQSVQPSSLRFSRSTFISSLTLSSLGLLSMSLLIGCNNASVNKLIESVTEQNESVTSSEEQFCNARTVPFAYAICEVATGDLTEKNSPLSLRLFWKAPQIDEISNNDIVVQNKAEDDLSKPLYTFDALLSSLSTNHSELKFAANAGMYNTEFAPIGYTVIQGKQILSINLNDGVGNFHLMPNGVLWWNKNGNVYITESHKLDSMLDEGVAKPWYATQSGPMLVINGNIHPKFNEGSDSKKIRNGVGVCDDGIMKFVNSEEPVNFYQFATLFKDDLHCPNALFLDGGIASALYAPNLDKKDNKNMGVMIGLVENLKVQNPDK